MEITNKTPTTEVSTDTSGSTSTPTTTIENSGTITAIDFSTFMKTALGKSEDAEVSEEELFAGLIEQNLTKKNEEAGKAYAEEKAKLSVSMAKADGFIPMEDVAKAALRNVVASGKVDAETAKIVHGESFAAAQLDDNLEALYDDRGGENDPTRAVAKVSTAITGAEGVLAKVAAGEITITARDLDIASNTVGGSTGGTTGGSTSGSLTPLGDSVSGSANPVDGAKKGFLWKPVSEHGTLAILMPENLKGLVKSVEVFKDGATGEDEKVAAGKFAAYLHGSDRGIWRFSQTGGSMGDNLTVKVTKSDGSEVTYDIADGSQRYD